MHPFRLTDAVLVADRLWFRYELKSRVAAARLVGPSVDLPLLERAPGLLEGPVPPASGRLTLLVEAATPGADLPWRVDVHLAPQALADYQAAESLGATADLDGGLVLRADRLRSGRDEAVLFWSCRSAEAGSAWMGDLHGNHVIYPYGLPQQRKGLRPAPARQPASALEVRVQAVSFPGGAPPAWRVQGGLLRTPGEWEIALAVPPERPSALTVGEEVNTGGGRVRLEEVWLSHFRTSLLFSGAGGMEVDLFTGLRLTYGSSVLKPQQGGQGEYRFAPLPPGVTHLTVSGAGAERHLHHPLELPLVPGGQGRPAQMEPGHWGGFSNRTVVVIPGSPGSPALPTGEAPFVPGQAADQPPAPAPDQAALRAWVEERLVPAHRLEIEPAEYHTLDPRQSHLAGPPFRPAGAPWPVCDQCDQPLTFIGQIRFPGQGDRLLTFHYCFDCLPHRPEDASAYRLEAHQNVNSTALEASSPAADRTPCRVTLVPVVSAPHWEDGQAELEGLDLGAHPWQAYRTEWEALTGAPNMESRVGGYPDWIQGPERPSCPCCGGPTTLLWQLDSERKAGLMWGDTGRIYIFECIDRCNPQSLALVMQCC